MKKTLNYLLLCCLATVSFQTMAQLSPSCTNNVVRNPNLSQGQAANSGDQNIDNATGFSRIWSTGSFAEFYVSNYAPANFPTPSPATGNYASCWIANYSAGGTVYREGFQVRLDESIPKNTGSYTVSFDMACLGGWGTSQVVVYGLYNPRNAHATNTPTGAYTPTNINLFGSHRTVLLGTTTISSCSSTKSRRSYTFNSDNFNFPNQGITHIFITSSDNSSISGARYMAFDNFCLPKAPAPCPVISGESLICTGFDFDFDGYLDYEYTFTVTPNQGSTSIALSCGRLNRRVINFNGGSGPATYTVTFYPSSNNCVFSAYHSLSSTNSNQCFGHQSNAVGLPCPGGGGGFGGFGRLHVSPNPAQTQVQLSWKEKEMPNQVSVELFNSSGVRVKSIQHVNSFDGNLKINVEDLPKGLYYIKMEGEEYAPEPVKFIKQ